MNVLTGEQNRQLHFKPRVFLFQFERTRRKREARFVVARVVVVLFRCLLMLLLLLLFSFFFERVQSDGGVVRYVFRYPTYHLAERIRTTRHKIPSL